MSSGHRNGLRGHGGRASTAGFKVGHSRVVSTHLVPTSSLRDEIGHPRMLCRDAGHSLVVSAQPDPTSSLRGDIGHPRLWTGSCFGVVVQNAARRRGASACGERGGVDEVGSVCAKRTSPVVRALWSLQTWGPRRAVPSALVLGRRVCAFVMEENARRSCAVRATFTNSENHRWVDSPRLNRCRPVA